MWALASVFDHAADHVCMAARVRLLFALALHQQCTDCRHGIFATNRGLSLSHTHMVGIAMRDATDHTRSRELVEWGYWMWA